MSAVIPIWHCTDGRVLFNVVPGSDPCADGVKVIGGDPEGQGGDVIQLQPEITQGSSDTGPGGLDPQAPGGPGQSRAWGQQLLGWLFGDDTATTTTPGPSGGCCAAEEEPRCLGCWLRRHRGWLLIAALAVAAYVLRKKP